MTHPLDQFSDEQVAQLRTGSETLFRRESRTLRHNLAEDWLWLDIDLTPLPASKHAEGSTKGKISAKKTARAASSPACMPRSITKRSSHGCTPASKPAARPICPSWRCSSAFWPSARHRKRVSSCARTRVL